MQITLALTHWWKGIYVFSLAYLGHLSVWRLRTPVHDVVTLVGIFAIPFLAFPWAPLPLAAWIFYALLAGNYIAIYPAFQASSPTIHLVAKLLEEKQMDVESLHRELARPSLLTDRIEDILRGGLAK